MQAELWTWASCPYCVAAIELLETRGVEYTNHVMDGKNAELSEIKQGGDDRLDDKALRSMLQNFQALDRDNDGRLSRDEFVQRMRSLGDATQPTDRVSIEPLEGSNALVVAASPENQKVIADLVDVLLVAERDRIGGQSFEIVSVTKNQIGRAHV